MVYESADHADIRRLRFLSVATARHVCQPIERTGGRAPGSGGSTAHFPLDRIATTCSIDRSA
jgi:hypothetical protein